jgi:hypothetical protein
MRFLRFLFGAGLVLLFVASAGAHHSFAALFDASRTVTLSGKVTEFEFQAPHSYIHIEVSSQNGEKAAWQIETTTPGMLIRKGITPDTLHAGQTISVTGNPTRDGRNIIRLLSIAMPDGTQIDVQ